MEIVLDTNVIIPAFLWGGKPKSILDLVFEGSITNYISREILDELFGVLSRPRFNADSRIIGHFVREIEDVSEMAYPRENIHGILRDEADHKILECAVASQADFIVTGDEDLLTLKEYQGTRILRVAEFLNLAAR